MRTRLSLPLALLTTLALSGASAFADIATPAATEQNLAAPSADDSDSNSAADHDSTGNESANNQADVPLVSGGVGDDDLAHLKSIQSQYNLKLLITETNGTFLSDITVHIEDKQGRTVADTVTDGPILLVKLPAGSYKITASRHDEVKNLKVSVKPGKLRAVQVAFEDTDPRVSGDPKTTPLE